MKNSSALLLFAAGAASAAVLEARATCNADNCLRALRATSILSGASSDCSSFVTATPTSFTTLPASTVTVTTYSIYNTAPAKRGQAEVLNPRDPVAVVPRSATPIIPTYASACSNSARYSSACSCLGVTAGPITASTTITSTVTPATTVTQTSTIPVCNPSDDYGLAWASGEWGPPTGNTAGFSSFSGTAAECCAACYTTIGCAFFEFFEGGCGLTTFGGGPVTNPYNKECPNGLAGFNFAPGDTFNPPQNVFGEGPCSGPFA